VRNTNANQNYNGNTKLAMVSPPKLGSSSTNLVETGGRKTPFGFVPFCFNNKQGKDTLKQNFLCLFVP
jgi:hypothetical protein